VGVEDPYDQFRAIVDAKFPAQTFQMRPNGARGGGQGRCCLALALATNQALKDLDFTS